MSSDFVRDYLQETATIATTLNIDDINRMIDVLVSIRERGGRLFFLGVGGGAAHASHAVNDFRKIAGFEAYAPTDNVAELTARANDEGWDTVFKAWLVESHLNDDDGVFVFSVGGGHVDRGVSVPLVRALEHARSVGASILGIVGPDGGYTRQVANASVRVPVLNPDAITPHTESFQAVIWHLLVTHPALQINKAKWESLR